MIAEEYIQKVTELGGTWTANVQAGLNGQTGELVNPQITIQGQYPRPDDETKFVVMESITVPMNDSGLPINSMIDIINQTIASKIPEIQTQAQISIDNIQQQLSTAQQQFELEVNNAKSESNNAKAEAQSLRYQIDILTSKINQIQHILQ